MVSQPVEESWVTGQAAGLTKIAGGQDRPCTEEGGARGD